MPHSDPRIETMYRADCRGAVLFVILLWAAIGFVFITIWPLVGAPVRLLLSGLISHAEADRPMKVGDVMELAGFWGDLLSR